MTLRITPFEDRVIVKLIAKETVSKGGIYVPDKAVEESTKAIVMIPNTVSYYRNGEKREPYLKSGDIVQIAKKAGTQMPESPDLEVWLAVPEDCIYYKVETIGE